MAKKKAGVNKSQAIKDYLAENPGASPSEVSEQLKSQGVDVSAAYVSTIKSTSKRKKKAARGAKKGVARAKGAGRPGRPGRPSRAATGGPDQISLSTLIAAKELVDKLGGPGRARNVIDALERLR